MPITSRKEVFTVSCAKETFSVMVDLPFGVAQTERERLVLVKANEEHKKHCPSTCNIDYVKKIGSQG